jgi:hypothetical protein
MYAIQGRRPNERTWRWFQDFRGTYFSLNRRNRAQFFSKEEALKKARALVTARGYRYIQVISVRY